MQWTVLSKLVKWELEMVPAKSITKNIHVHIKNHPERTTMHRHWQLAEHTRLVYIGISLCVYICFLSHYFLTGVDGWSNDSNQFVCFCLISFPNVSLILILRYFLFKRYLCVLLFYFQFFFVFVLNFRVLNCFQFVLSSNQPTDGTCNKWMNASTKYWYHITRDVLGEFVFLLLQFHLAIACVAKKAKVRKWWWMRFCPCATTVFLLGTRIEWEKKTPIKSVCVFLIEDFPWKKMARTHWYPCSIAAATTAEAT